MTYCKTALKSLQNSIKMIAVHDRELGNQENPYKLILDAN